MIERFVLYDIDKLRDLFGLKDGVPKGVKINYNIQPTQTIPVIVQRGENKGMELMQWGFVPQNAKDMNSVFRYKTHQARSEDVFSRSIWQNAIRTQRCLIPANGFYEWRKAPDGKHAFYLHPTNQPLFAFAGIYCEWTDPSGATRSLCAIITTASDSGSDQIPSRLPVIVEPAEQASWLDPTVSDVRTLIRIMRPLEPSELTVTRVSDAISSTKAKSAELIAPLQQPGK